MSNDDGYKCQHGRMIKRCQLCLEIGDRVFANMSVSGHLKEAARSLFYFKFMHFIVDITWTIQKITKTGDFGPDGYFSKYIHK